MDLSLTTTFGNVLASVIVVICISVFIVTSTLLVFILGLMPGTVPDCIFQQCEIIFNGFNDGLDNMPSEILDLQNIISILSQK